LIVVLIDVVTIAFSVAVAVTTASFAAALS
jgi:hypothetical protein